MTYRKELSSARKDKNHINTEMNNVNKNYEGNSGNYIKELEFNHTKEERKVEDYIEKESEKHSKNSIDCLNVKNNDSSAFESNLNQLPSIEKVNFNDKRANLKSAVIRRPIK